MEGKKLREIPDESLSKYEAEYYSSLYQIIRKDYNSKDSTIADFLKEKTDLTKDFIIILWNDILPGRENISKHIFNYTMRFVALIQSGFDSNQFDNKENRRKLLEDVHLIVTERFEETIADKELPLFRNIVAPSKIKYLPLVLTPHSSNTKSRVISPTNESGLNSKDQSVLEVPSNIDEHRSDDMKEKINTLLVDYSNIPQLMLEENQSFIQKLDMCNKERDGILDNIMSEMERLKEDVINMQNRSEKGSGHTSMDEGKGKSSQNPVQLREVESQLDLLYSKIAKLIISIEKSKEIPHLSPIILSPKSNKDNSKELEESIMEGWNDSKIGDKTSHKSKMGYKEYFMTKYTSVFGEKKSN